MKVLKVILLVSFLSMAVTALASDGATLYKKCIACHGTDGSKVALKVGAPIKGQTEQELYEKMKGYQDGTYGGEKKAIMKRNVDKLTDDDLKALAAYIATF